MTRIALTPQSEDQAVIEAVAPYLRDEFALSRLAAAPGALDPLFWSHIAELGWTTAALDESQGGTGMDLVQEMLMNREFGRALAPVSVLSTALGLRLLAQQGQRLPPALTNGTERIGFAAFMGAGRTDPVLEGEVHLVDPEAQQFLLVDGHGAALFSRAAVPSLTAMDCLDPTVGLARATLRGVSARYISSADSALPLRAQLLIAAQLTGIALAASAMAAEYAKVRVQFGKPIGAFQAVAHLCVDAAVRARASDAQVAVAAIATRDGWRDAQLQVTAATVLASSAALLSATNNIQVHGGMGYSAESGAHLFLKRSVLLERLLPARDEAEAILLRPAEEVRA
jgi:alkylation response protein AidB-like acyl-CoA dehydrogenase